MNDLDLSIKSGKIDFGFLIELNEVWVSSRKIAEVFEKDHSKVIRSIEQILETKDNFNESNFGLVKYKDKKGEMRKEYKLNRKSFTLVVMGFTGEKAMQFKKEYIDAFEAMTEVLKTRIISKSGYKEMTDAIKLTGLDLNNSFVYSEEANMINRIVLDMSAKRFKELNNIDEDESLRDAVVNKKLEILDRCQKLNASLILSGINQSDRKQIINNYYFSINKAVNNE